MRIDGHQFLSGCKPLSDSLPQSARITTSSLRRTGRVDQADVSEGKRPRFIDGGVVWAKKKVDAATTSNTAPNWLS
jgi:hypothetical protein